MRLSGITRSFGATRAVDDVSLEIRSGEILAIVGENGAGKTTLMRIAAGELAPDSGTIDDGQRVALVHQHFMLVSELTIAENLALVDPRPRFATRKMLAREAERTIAESGLDLRDVSRRVADLSVGEKSKLELIKAVAGKPSTLILDEPTSVLTPPETEELFRVMHALAANGTAIVFISHKLPEVLAVADRIVVMRAGRVVMETTKAATDGEELANGMTPHPPGACPERSRRGHLLPASGEKGDDCPSPRLRGEGGRRPGEGILAIVGVAGNGQAELVAELRAQHDRRRMGLIPEDRARDGIIAQMSIAENLALTKDRWNPRAAIHHAVAMIDLYSIRAQGPRQPAGDLSGGNQQKVVLARELDAQPEVIIAAEPTRGLDIEATAFVHERLRDAAAAGTRIVLITSDLDEAFALADAIQVIYRGKLSERMTPQEATTRVANLMAGVA